MQYSSPEERTYITFIYCKVWEELEEQNSKLVLYLVQQSFMVYLACN